MESFVTFKPLTPRLKEIRSPVLLMNGEHDFFTPRECHELLRRELPNCRLMLVQHAYHAFTLELPDITLRQLHEFFRAWTTAPGSATARCGSRATVPTPNRMPFRVPGITCARCRCPRPRAARRRAPARRRRSIEAEARARRHGGRATGRRRPA